MLASAKWASPLSLTVCKADLRACTVSRRCPLRRVKPLQLIKECTKATGAEAHTGYM